MSITALKRRITTLLQTRPLDSVLAEIAKLPPRQVVNPLIANLSRAEWKNRWSAVAALGPVVAALADEDMESARVIMRRFMWSLNDESGGIGWGVPEAMAEVMANHDGLAEEYAHMLVAYMREDGFFLELPALQRGLMWGVGRLAEVRPDLLHKFEVSLFLRPYLDSEDAEVRGLAARAFGILQAKGMEEKLKALLHDHAELLLHDKGEITRRTVGALADEALARIEISPCR